MAPRKSRISRNRTLATTSAATGSLSVRMPSPMTNPSSAKLSTQFDADSGFLFTAARVIAFVRCAPALPPRRHGPSPPRCSWSPRPQRHHRDDGAAQRSDRRVDRIPEQVDPRDLVRKKLDAIQRERDYDVVVEDSSGA